MQSANLVHGHVFICHDGSEGCGTALWIADHFTVSATGVSCWIAERNIIEPKDAIDDVHRAIQSCSCVVLVATSKALEKNSRAWREMETAYNYKKPVVVASTSDCDPLPRLARRPIVTIRASDDRTFDDLLVAVTSTATVEGIRENLFQYKEDAKETLAYFQPEHEQYVRIEREISEFDDQIVRLEEAIRDPKAARERIDNRIGSGIELSRIPLDIPVSKVSVPFVYRPPIEAPPYFENRFDETKAVIDFLESESGRLIVVTGRGGVGKSSLICRILHSLERGQLPDSNAAYQVEGIIYLSYLGKKPSLSNLFMGLVQIVSEVCRQRMMDLLKNEQILVQEKVAALVSEFESSPKSNPVVVLLDNMEDGIDPETLKIIDSDIREFLEQLVSCVGNRIRVILTSRIAPADFSEVSPSVKVDLPLNEGLKSPHAENLFRSLDPMGACGLKDASEELLGRLRKFTKGFPKAIEAVVTILRSPETSVNELLEAEIPDDRIVEVLVGEAFSRLLIDDQLVMEALAVFGQPVPPAAIDYVLRPWFAHIDASLSLVRLGNMRFVRKEGPNYFQHPTDRRHALMVLEQRSPEETDEGKTGEAQSHSSPSSKTFTVQAADYFREVKTPRARWETINDIDAHVAEFQLRLDLDDDLSASDILSSVEGFIDKCGAFQLLLSLAQSLEQKARSSSSRKIAFAGARVAMWRVGRVEDAVQYQEKLIGEQEGDSFGVTLEKLNIFIFGMSMGQYEKALPEFERICGTLAERRWDAKNHYVALNQLGNLCGNLGYLGRAIQHQEEALEKANQTDDPDSIEAQTHNLAGSIMAVGRIDEALTLYKKALEYVEKSKNPLWEANHLSAIGKIERDKGNLEEASLLFDAELAIRQRIGDVSGIISNRRREAHWLLELGDIQTAESMADECRSQLRKIRGRTYQTDFLLAQIRLAQSNWAEAERCARESLKTNIEESTFARRNLLAIALASQGKNRAAIAEFEAALDVATEWLNRCDQNADAFCHKAISSIGLTILGNDKLDDAVDAFESARAVNSLPGAIQSRRWWFNMVAAIPADLDLAPAVAAIDGADPYPPPPPPEEFKDVRNAPRMDRVHEILFLAASPLDTQRLRLEEECRDISEVMRGCRYRKNFSFRSGWAVRTRDLNKHLLDIRPTIVHFAGHGEGPAGIVLEDKSGRSKLVATQTLETLFSLFAKTIDCVVLNCCFSAEQATAIARCIPHVVGMNNAIGDEAAIEFANGFYDGLGGGLSYREAFTMGLNTIDLAGIPEECTPQHFSIRA